MIHLTRRQKQILYGIILGDGYLQATGKKNARLRLEHSDKQKNYLFWKVKMLDPLFQGKPKYLERIHPKTKMRYCYWRHQSQSTPYLGRLRRVFYPDGKKKILDKLEDYLDPQMFAVWFMDDGYYCRRDNSNYLYLGKVTAKEGRIVQKALKEVFGIGSTILDKKNKGRAVYFAPKMSKKLKNLLWPYVLSEFRYKFPPGPVTTDPALFAKGKGEIMGT